LIADITFSARTYMKIMFTFRQHIIQKKLDFVHQLSSVKLYIPYDTRNKKC